MKTARHFLFFLLTAGTVLGSAVPGGNVFPKSASAAEAKQAKILVVFYSWSGNTGTIASQIHKKVGGDLVELELAKPYSGNYNTCLDEAKRDQERNARPALKTEIADIEQYDVIFLGYPNWWGTIPMPIATLLEQYNFSGKTIAPFCSHGGGRLGQSVTDIVKLAPGSKITEALSAHYTGGNSLPREMDDWLRKIGIKP